MWFRKGDCNDCAAKNRTKKPPFLFGFCGVCRINKSGCIKRYSHSRCYAILEQNYALFQQVDYHPGF